MCPKASQFGSYGFRKWSHGVVHILHKLEALLIYQGVVSLNVDFRRFNADHASLCGLEKLSIRK